MRVGPRQVWGATALLVLGTACGGSAKSEAPGGSAGADSIGASGTADSAGGSTLGSAGASGATSVGGAANAGAGSVDPNGGQSGGPPVGIGSQKQATKLDVLFVVDNSVSMADKQGVLESSLAGFVNRLVNPPCVDDQGLTVDQPASASAACSSGKRPMTPVTDLHLGVITTSIGGHGGDGCDPSTEGADSHLDDQAQLVASQRTGVASYQGRDFLSYDAAGKTGVTDASAMIGDLQAMVASAGERGCGYEAPLEAMYRFLVDPEPPVSVNRVQTVSVAVGVNNVLFAQRKAFLRPGSAVAIVILSDENDCSVRDDGVGWLVSSTSRMPRASSACDSNPNDPCCRSCAQNESKPPDGCKPLSEDATCETKDAGTTYATWDPQHDSLNMRCFQQQKRFGFDLLYPVERYGDALTNPKISNRAGDLVDNPLLVGRSATLLSLSTIVGVPWEDIVTTDSLTSGNDIDYLRGDEMKTEDRWSLVLGDASKNQPPTDPYMVESIAPRSGENPLLHVKIADASSVNPTASPINGHEHFVPNNDDLQYACTFQLLKDKPCASGDSACDCSPDKTGDVSALVAANSPLCQDPGGIGTTQYYAKGYPGARELRLVQLLGERALPASICPAYLITDYEPNIGYVPAFRALIRRIATTLK